MKFLILPKLLIAWISVPALCASSIPARVQGEAEVKYFHSIDEMEFGPGGAKMQFALFIPQTYTARIPAPLVLALHYGGRVTPTYGKEFVEILILPALGDLEAVIVAPNCPGRGWTDPVSGEAVTELLDRITKRFAVDPKKIIVSGFSMGAIGAYHLGAIHPNLFSAVLAVSGIPAPDDLPLLKDIPVYAVQSTADEIFPAENARAAFGQMKEQGVRIEIDFIEGVSHYRTFEFVPALKRAVPWLRRLWGEKERGTRVGG